MYSLHDISLKKIGLWLTIIEKQTLHKLYLQIFELFQQQTIVYNHIKEVVTECFK